MLVTDLTRTVVDVAKMRGLTRAAVVGDAALNTETRKALAATSDFLSNSLLLEYLEGSGSWHGAARARDAISFMDARAESPGESVSRVSIWRAGVPAPVLQQSFSPWSVDFWWPDYGVIGEFDGAVKYLDPRVRGGRTAEEVVLDEKAREDALRRRSKGFARWNWAVACSPTALAARLSLAGIPEPKFRPNREDPTD
jgi:hypothetical protein